MIAQIPYLSKETKAKVSITAKCLLKIMSMIDMHKNKDAVGRPIGNKWYKVNWRNI